MVPPTDWPSRFRHYIGSVRRDPERLGDAPVVVAQGTVNTMTAGRAAVRRSCCRTPGKPPPPPQEVLRTLRTCPARRAQCASSVRCRKQKKRAAGTGAPLRCSRLLRFVFEMHDGVGGSLGAERAEETQMVFTKALTSISRRPRSRADQCRRDHPRRSRRTAGGGTRYDGRRRRPPFQRQELRLIERGLQQARQGQAQVLTAGLGDGRPRRRARIEKLASRCDGALHRRQRRHGYRQRLMTQDAAAVETPRHLTSRSRWKKPGAAPATAFAPAHLRARAQTSARRVKKPRAEPAPKWRQRPELQCRRRRPYEGRRDDAS